MRPTTAHTSRSVTTELKRPQSQRERREVMPISSEFCELMFREFEGLHSFTAVENGYEHSYQRGE